MNNEPQRSLRLPVNVSIGENQLQKIRDEWNTIGGVEAEITARGFVERNSPGFTCPEVTEASLSTPDSQAYTEMYAQLLAWFNYASPILARVRARVLQYENVLDRVAPLIRKVLYDQNKLLPKAERMTAEQIKDEVMCDPMHLEVSLELQKHQQYKIEWEAYVDNIERSLKVVSRQVEIRKVELESNRQQGNMPGRNNFPLVGRKL